MRLSLAVLFLSFVHSIAWAQDFRALVAAIAEGRLPDRAVQILQEQVAKDPSAPSWKLWLGLAFCLNGQWDPARRCYEEAKGLSATASHPWFPPLFPSDWLGRLIPVTRRNLSHRHLWTSPLVLWEGEQLRDPLHRESFPFVAFVYTSDSKMARRICTAFLQSLDDLPTTTDWIARFSDALLSLGERFRVQNLPPVKLWIFRDGDGSSFTGPGYTALYGIKRKDPANLVCSAAHEAAHHLVPAFGPFAGLHEPYSGGFVGERLYLFSLLDQNGEAPLPDFLDRLWRDRLIPETVRGQQFLLSLRDQEKQEPEMNAFIGVAIYLERLLGEAFYEILPQAPDPSWNGFLSVFEAGMQQQMEKSVLRLFFRAPGATFPLPVPPRPRDGVRTVASQVHPLWLPKGIVAAEIDCEGEGELDLFWNESLIATVRANARCDRRASFLFESKAQGWGAFRALWRRGKGKVSGIHLRLVTREGENG